MMARVTYARKKTYCALHDEEIVDWDGCLSARTHRMRRVAPNLRFRMNLYEPSPGPAWECETCRNYNPVKRRCRRYADVPGRSFAGPYCKYRIGDDTDAEVRIL
jgi:hypothetical protein